MKRPEAVRIRALDKYKEQLRKDKYLHIKGWGYFYILPARKGKLINPHCGNRKTKYAERPKFKSHNDFKDFINSNN